jgi:hypothetical protein
VGCERVGDAHHGGADLHDAEERGDGPCVHGHGDGDPVVGAEPGGPQSPGDPVGLLGQYPVGDRADAAVLPEHHGRRLGRSPEAGLHDVEPRSGEPPDPLDPFGEVEDRRGRLCEHDAEVFDDRRPEGAPVGHRPFEQLGDGGEAGAGQETGQVGAGDRRLVGDPRRAGAGSVPGGEHPVVDEAMRGEGNPRREGIACQPGPRLWEASALESCRDRIGQFGRLGGGEAKLLQFLDRHAHGGLSR